MIIRKMESKDLANMYSLLNDNKIEYNIFNKKYEESLNDNCFYGIVAEENNQIIGVSIARLINRLVKSNNTFL